MENNNLVNINPSTGSANLPDTIFNDKKSSDQFNYPPDNEVFYPLREELNEIYSKLCWDQQIPPQETYASSPKIAVPSEKNSDEEEFFENDSPKSSNEKSQKIEKTEEMPEMNMIKKNEKPSRSDRGLRMLSVRVKEIVHETKKSTYKEVADILINELLQKKKSGISNDISESSKDEKNIRRRAYDALNVLIAAGIVRKEGKNVCYENALEFNDNLLQITNTKEKLKKINEIKEELKKNNEIIESNKLISKDLRNKKILMKELIRRNKHSNKMEKTELKIPLPFFGLTTSSSPDHVINCKVLEGDNKTLISMENPFNILTSTHILEGIGLKAGQES